ncbi:glycosyltransferase family 4 protein [Sediminibacterium sp. TEGAF015]|uniref:glycosyltransferase family 4 protein n=1 Tax=Sediminibacterium sp. TEGAF015 TaxID=575378 RepID=UPI0021FD06AB|nr:glycosyltransferase family 1 protein [Sediminibacterium sp. TEGAF015]BDQ13371.1 glycosyl transferase family 1 [Sediminibacterium sp. TEGAF015]
MQKSKQVRVGVDILDLQYAKTGQKTILEEYYRAFLKNQDLGIAFFPLTAKLPKFSRKSKWGIIGNHLVYQYWKQILLPVKAFAKGVDIVFCTDYFAPMLRLRFKNVALFHDAFFYEYPEHYNRLWLKLFKGLAMPAARSAACVVTTSQYAKQKIHQHFGFPLDQIVNIYPGPKTLQTKLTQDSDTRIANESVSDSVQHAILNSNDLPTQPYILHVGVWEKRKNIPFLLKAYRQFLDESSIYYSLVLVGTGNNKKDSDDTAAIHACIADLNLYDHVICTGYLPDEELAQWYAGASLYVFPSYNEGFGIPVLEAFQSNLPVLVANNSCLPEVGGDAVIGFDPYDINGLADLLKKVLSDTILQETLKENGKQRLAYFSWEKASAELIKVFKKAAHGKS